ncbi:CBS domain protein [archaeon BMS3Abin16]|nr:CBS domain protein [archaeon BMS3Abin16]GBE56795.1 CBS domain protein [archaeon BMS3Bbin16]
MYSIPTPEEIKQFRRRVDKTQSEVAKKANVSQSLIARIEKGSIDPRVSTLRKILDALKEEEKVERITAKTLMRSPVISVSAEDSLKKASKIMDENNISQIPVVRKGAQVGSISEERLVHEMSSGKDLSKLSSMRVKDIMGGGFPVVTENTDLETLSRLVEFNSCVLIVEREKLAGIVTKTDVLKLVK